MGKDKPKSHPPESSDNMVTRTMKSTVKAFSGIARSIYGDSHGPATKSEHKSTHASEKRSAKPTESSKASDGHASKGDGHSNKGVAKPQSDAKSTGTKATQHQAETRSDMKSAEGRKSVPKHPESTTEAKHATQKNSTDSKHPNPKNSTDSRHPNPKNSTDSKHPNPKNSTDSKHPATEKPAEKTSLSNYIYQLKERAKTNITEEIAKVKTTAKFLEDNLHKVENTAAKTLKEISAPPKDAPREPKPLALNKMTPEQRVRAGQFEYTDEKTNVSYKYDKKTGNVQEMQRGDTTTHFKYDKTGNAAGMEVKQGNHILAQLDNKDSSKIKVDQVTGAINVEAVNKDSKSHVKKETTTYQPDGTVTNVGYDANGHRTSKVGFAMEGDQLSRKYRVDYVYTQGEKEKPGEVFSVTRNLEEKNPAKQVVEKCWYDDPKNVEKQTPSIKEKISRDPDNSTKVTRAYKDGRSEELRLDSHGHTTEFHVRNPKGHTVKYEVKDDKIVGAKVDGEEFKDATLQASAQKDLARMKNLYNFQIKAAQAEKVEQPVGLTDYALTESKTGTIVIETDDGIHSYHARFGEVRDKNKNLIGHLDKDNKLTLENGVDLKIGKQRIKDGTSLDQMEGSSFFDTHDILNNRQAIESNGPGKNGMLLRPDGRLGGIITKNNVFDETGEYLGKLDSSGTLTKSIESGKGKIDINSELRGYSFIGKERGQDRRFIMSSNMSNGEISLDDPPGKHKVEMGMILVKDQNGNMVQKGIVEAPNFAGGKLDGGSITLFKGKESETKPLCASKGTVIDLEIKGEGAVKSQRIQAVCLGEQVVASDQKSIVSGGFFDIQDAKAREKRLVRDAEMKLKEKDDDVVGHWAGGFAQLGGKSDYDALKETVELTHRRSDQKLASLDQIVKDGKVDLNSLGFYNRELEHLTQTPKTKPEPKKHEEPKTVLKRPDLKDKVITGKARVGNELIEFKDNHVMVDGKSVGEVTPDYVIKIKGRAPIDLKQEDRVLMEFKFEGPGASNETHQLVGLGRTKVGLNGRMYEGGLVDTKSLTAEASQRQVDMEKAIKEYKDGRHITSGVSNYFLGDAEGTMDQQVATFRTQKSGLEKEFQTLFKEGFNPKDLDNNRVDQCTRATQLMMENCRTTTADGTELVQRTTQLEQQANEGLIMATTTIATMGVGAAFNGLANAGKLANLSRVTVLTTEVGVTGVAGGTISVIGRHTEKGGWNEAYTNLASGTMEGMANSLNAFGTMMKAQGLGKLGVTMNQLSQAEVNMANLAKASVRVEQLVKGDIELAQVSKAMVTIENLNKAGLTTKGLAKVGITAEELNSGAVSMERLMQAGLKEKDLAKVSFSVEELGKHSLDLQKVPVALEELQRCGVPLEQLAAKGVQIAGPGEKIFTTADQMLLDSNFGQLSTKIANNPIANAVLKNSLQLGEGAAQTALYDLAAGVRSKDGLNLQESLGPERLLTGTLFNVGAQTIGNTVGNLGKLSQELEGSKNKFLSFLGEERALSDIQFRSKRVFNDFASECFTQFASRLPSEVSTAYANGAMSSINDAIKNEKQRVAEKLGHAPTEQELYENMNYTRVLQEIHEQGAMAAASSPLISIAGSPIHAWSEKYAPKSRLSSESVDSLQPEQSTASSVHDSTANQPDSKTSHDSTPKHIDSATTKPEAPKVASDSAPEAPATKTRIEPESRAGIEPESPAVIERQRQSLEQLASQHTKEWKHEYGKEPGLKVIDKEGREQSFLEAIKKASDALCNSGEPGDTRPIRKDMFHEVNIVKSALADNPEQLKIYNEYVEKRRAYETSAKELHTELESRRSDVQKMIDTYCRENALAPIEVTHSLDIHTTAKGYRNGKLDIAMSWLLKERLNETELNTLHAELRKVGRENETVEYKVRAAQAKTERQLADLEKICTDNTKNWREVGNGEVGLAVIDADGRFKIRQEITEKLVDELCHKTGADGKPIIQPERFHDIDYARTKLSGEQLAQYEKYVEARQKHEDAERTLRRLLDERLNVLQAVMDQYCEQNHQPHVTLKRTHHLADTGKEYSDGAIVIGSRELLKSGPSDALREFLVRESSKAESRSLEFDAILKDFDPHQQKMRKSPVDYSFRRIHDFPSEEARDRFLYLQMKVDKHSVLQRETIRKFAENVKEIGDSFTPVDKNLSQEEKQVIIKERLDALRKAHIQAFGEPPPRIVVLSDREMAESGADAGYLRGRGITQLRESEILGHSLFSPKPFIHEGVHVTQDRAIIQAIATDLMRQKDIDSFDKLKASDGSWTPEGRTFLAELQNEYKSRTAFTDFVPLNEKFFQQAMDSSRKYLEESVKLSADALNIDPEYVRGRRLASDLHKKEQRSAERQADLSEKMLNLARALTPRDLSGNGLRNYLNELFTQAHRIEDGPNPLAEFEAKKLLQKVCSNPMFRNELFGNNHHLTGGIGEFNRKDRQFEDMLYRAVSDNNPPDFVANIVEAAIRRSANPGLNPTESREVWLRQMEEHLNDSAAAPSTPKAFNRTELRTYAFLLEHFKNPRNGSIGSLTRQRFEEALPILMKELVKDSIKEAIIHDQLVYFGNLAETETRHTDSLVDEWAKGRGSDKEAPLTTRQKMYSDKLGKFWMSGEQSLASGPSTSDGVMNMRPDNPLLRMMKIQQMQEQQKYGDLNMVEQGAIPDNYYRTENSEEQAQQYKSHQTDGADSSTRDDSKGNSQSEKRLQDRSGGQNYKEGGTGEKSQLPSGDELADMPQKPTQSVGDVPKQQSTQYPQEYHAQLEANRINRLNIHRHLAKGNILDHVAKAQNLIAELSNAPAELNTAIQVMAHSHEKARILEQVLKYHDPAALPEKLADAIRNEEQLTYAEMRKIMIDCHPSDLQVGLRLTERVSNLSDPEKVREYWKEAVQSYTRIDEENLSKVGRAQYQELGTRLESEMRTRVSDITAYLEAPQNEGTRKNKPTDGFVAKQGYAPRYNPQDGRAQEVTFAARAATALNSRLLSDVVIAEQPQVLSKDKQLVDTIKRDLKDELASETAYLVKRGVKQDDAERQALFTIIRGLTDSTGSKDAEAYTAVEQQVDRAINDAMNRGKDWIGLPIPSNCVLDKFGCDYLLINKRTGEYFPLDVTIHGIEKIPGQLVDCRAMNPHLKWDAAKTIPSDREKWIMSVPSEKEWNDALFQSTKEASGDSKAGRTQLEQDAVEQISVALLATIQSPSRLNLIDHPLPQNLTTMVATDELAACTAFTRNLARAGMHRWATDLQLRAVPYIQNQIQKQAQVQAQNQARSKPPQPPNTPPTTPRTI